MRQRCLMARAGVHVLTCLRLHGNERAPMSPAYTARARNGTSALELGGDRFVRRSGPSALLCSPQDATQTLQATHTRVAASRLHCHFDATLAIDTRRRGRTEGSCCTRPCMGHGRLAAPWCQVRAAAEWLPDSLPVRRRRISITGHRRRALLALPALKAQPSMSHCGRRRVS